ncbi:efflux RND transporter periplasmic adaptor subunit [Sinimarinibacterium sp. CAU 1509]|nr:efflux RND transporter periplasmic adaptor subunit [Sinimarinibacterium sp. CAU 1509]
MRFLVSVLLAGVLSACGGKSEQTAAPPPAPAVGIVTLAAQPVTMTAELSGRTTAFMVAEVRPQITGIVQKRLFDEGAEVKAGQVLYQIDAAPYRAAFDSASAALAKAQASQATLKLQAQRYAELAQIDAVSKQENDDAQAAVLQADAEVAAAKAALQTARINLNYTRITAPIDGQVATSIVTPGALVTANQADALTTVRQLDPIYVDITQSSAEVLALRRRIASGQVQRESTDTIKVHLRLEDGGSYEHVGKLSFTGVAVDEGTGTVRLRAVFPNPDSLLLPGMYVRAVVTQGVDREGLRVPQKGVTHNARGEAIALVVKDDNTVEQRVIETASAVGDEWIVTSGLKPGDRVIVEGLQKARVGAAVQPQPVGGDAATAVTPTP